MAVSMTSSLLQNLLNIYFNWDDSVKIISLKSRFKLCFKLQLKLRHKLRLKSRLNSRLKYWVVSMTFSSLKIAECLNRIINVLRDNWKLRTVIVIITAFRRCLENGRFLIRFSSSEIQASATKYTQRHCQHLY